MLPQVLEAGTLDLTADPPRLLRAGAIDPDRGWGLVDETWSAMAGLERYAGVRPDGSGAAATWFNLGDRDLAIGWPTGASKCCWFPPVRWLPVYGRSV